MSAISNLFSLFVTAAIIVGALVFIVSPRTAAPIFKRIGILLVAFVLWLVLIERLIRAVIESWWLPLLLVAASIAAYCVREALRRKPASVKAPAGGAERTPIMPGQYEGNRDENDPVGD